MTSRDRVIKAINRQQPDRVPIDLGGMAASGICVDAYYRVKMKLGLRTDEVKVYEIFGMMAWVEQDIIDAFSVDTMMVPALCPSFNIPINRWKRWTLKDGTPVKVPLGFITREEKDGSLLLMVEGEPVGKMPADSLYFSEPAKATMGAIDSMVDPPDPDKVEFPLLEEKDLNFRRDVARNLYQTTDKALILDIADSIRWNTSVPNWLFAIASEPQRTSELHEKKSLNLIERLKQLWEAVGSYAQVITIYQDLGTQRSELISPESFESLIVPHYKRISNWIHHNTTWKFMLHSCGSIYGFIPHMISMGVDILNPVQCAAKRMDAANLKARFGDKIVFWGGGTDTQTVLVFGTVEEVIRHVLERILLLGHTGGFIFAPTQEILAEVPTENIIAMYQAAYEYGRYPLR